MHKLFSKAWDWLSSEMQVKNTRRIVYVATLVASFCFIALSIYVNWNDLDTYKWELNYKYIILAILLQPLGMLPTVAAWHNLLKAFGVHLPFFRNLRVYAISSLPRHIPGYVMYVSSRTMLYQEDGVPTASTILVTGAELVMLAITGFISSSLLLFLGETTILIFPEIQYILPAALLIIVIIVASTPIFNKLLQKLGDRGKLNLAIRINRKYIVWNVLWLFIAWIGGGFTLFMLVNGFTPLPWSYLPIIVGIWGLSSAVGIAIGGFISGFGLREITLAALLSLVISPIMAIVAAVSFRLVFTIGEVLWVLIATWVTKIVPRETEGRNDV